MLGSFILVVFNVDVVLKCAFSNVSMGASSSIAIMQATQLVKENRDQNFELLPQCESPCHTRRNNRQTQRSLFNVRPLTHRQR